MTIQAESPASPTAFARSALVDEICERLARHEEGGEGSLLCDFAREFFAKVPRQLVQERGLEDLLALTVGAFRFFQSSAAEGVNVQIVNPEEEGWDAPVTAIRAQVSDRPFIVDTIREFLGTENIPIQHYVYPVLRVIRGADGTVKGIGRAEAARRESFIHCEISRVPDADRREWIRGEIERRLHDVVAATDDFRPMLEALDRTVATIEGATRHVPDRSKELNEMREFLQWLREDNFVFMGYRAYDIVDPDGEGVLRVEPRTGLGILRREEHSTWAEGTPLSELSEPLRRRVVGGPLLIVSKTNAESTVHRRARMDYIGVKKIDEKGRVVGERRFLGLFTSKAYAEHADRIPILRTKLEEILASSGAAPGSHDYKEIITIFNSMPKEELFQASVPELEREVQTVLALLFADEVQVTLRQDPLGRGVSVMVILPRGKFSGEVRHKIQDLLTRRFEGTTLNYHLAMSAGDQARLHFYLSSSAEVASTVAPEEIEREIVQIIRSWEDRLLEELISGFGEGEGQKLAAAYRDAFHEEYRAANLPEIAVQDIIAIEEMRREDRSVAIALREPRGRGRAHDFQHLTVLKLYLRDERLVLSDFMPILDNAGLRVVEVTPYSLSGAELPGVMIYSFAVQLRSGEVVPLERAGLLSEALLAIRAGDATNDLFNSLVLGAGLRWREVEILRTYANYAFQIGSVPTRLEPARALVKHPEIGALLVALFTARFDPDGPRTRAEREKSMKALRTQIHEALEGVNTLADDRALRRLVILIEATTRTNFFRHGAADPTFRSGGVPYISIKIRCADVEEMRRNRLLYEVFVFSSRMEGIHLRGAAVSRGGLRWSDRPNDFRMEVMGLVQTQIVKNAVIVPGGSKGGFITKRSFADRDQMMAEAADQYRTLIRGLLDITDNLVDGKLVPPKGVVRHDGDDPYLVVAADKGTAHLSDVANAIAEEYGFWLLDAFASGGSYGYDHKKEGITARGGWECVKRHFREMGKDIQTEPFTVSGVGDMSGDVFGNGMLLSRQIRLIAAFDHRNIFIDPDPDPETSYAERERIFALPRSSWEDYDRSVLSAGAMIVPRASKEVQITPEARRALGLGDEVTGLDGEGLVRAVLQAPVELFWNGGIGTYVKDRDETNSEVGDSANDPVRINAEDLRCLVIGEGGNLGLTQLARIRFSLRGGRINTDALDNSGGVDMSDHEVNIKILLNPMVLAGEMEFDARNRLLQEMTDEVSHLVLHNNISQSLAVSLDHTRSRDALGDFAALITGLERDGLLERAAEDIPSSDELAERAREGIGLSRPTLCVLLAYAKLYAQASLLQSPLPDEPSLEEYLVSYFPADAVTAAGIERLRQHRLRREIITTQMVNDLVDLMGASFVHRVARETSEEIDVVVRAWFIACALSGATEIRRDLEQLEGKYPVETIYRWLFGLARVLDRTTRWTLANIPREAQTQEIIAEHRSGLERLRAEFTRLVTGDDRLLFEERMQELKEFGVDQELAARLITLRFLPELLDILRIAQDAGTDAVETARAYYLVSDRYGPAWLQQSLRATVRDEVWEKRLGQTLISDVGHAHREISRRLLECHAGGPDVQACLEQFEQRHEREIEQYLALLEELKTMEMPSLPGYAVAVRNLLELTE